jgi:hypothetical protein
MSFSYKLAEGLPDERDQVRLLVSDTDSENFLMDDEEIDFFLSQEPNIYWSAATVANTMIIRLGAGFLEDQKVGETRIRAKRINELKLLIDQWRARGAAHQLPSAGGIFLNEQQAMDLNSNILKSDFFRGMSDYPGTTRKSRPPIGRADI